MVINTDSKLVFTHRKDIEELVVFLSNMVDLMSTTLEKVSQVVGMDEHYPYDDMIEIYKRIAEGPTVLEEILIKKGSTTLEECQINYFEKRLLMEINYLKEKAKEKNNNDN